MGVVKMSESSLWLQVILTGLSQGSLFALVAIGFNIIYNVAALPNFSQAEFATIAAFATFYMIKAFHLPLIVVALLVILLAAAIGIIIQMAVFYPARNLPHMNQVLITCGIQFILQGAVLVIWGIDPIVSLPFTGSEPIDFFGAKISTQSLWVIGLTMILTASIYLFFSRTIWGKALRSVAEKRDIAGIVGINASKMDALAWVLAAMIGAVGGIIIAPLYPFVYESGLMIVGMVFCSIAIGGMGNILGGLAGGMLIGMLLAVGAGFFAAFKEIVVFVVLLIVLTFRPQGLLGGKQG
jgi:branched-chain amino acid transport system permease protein